MKSPLLVGLLLVSALLLPLLLAPSQLAVGSPVGVSIQRVSVASDGSEGNGVSSGSYVSDDGYFAVFFSDSTNLVSGGTSGTRHTYRRNLITGQTALISRNTSTGAVANNLSVPAAISPDGRYTLFTSTATNLVSNDTNDRHDVFLYDATVGAVSRVSLALGSIQANDTSTDGDISADGRYVVFASAATNLTGDQDGNAVWDIFLRDRLAATTILLSQAVSGGTGDASSSFPSISADGRYIVFDSSASDLVPNDTNGERDTFLYDRTTGSIEIVSVGWDGGPSTGEESSTFADVSADGRYVAFHSSATNLVISDTNALVDVFVRDRELDQTFLISRPNDGKEVDEHSGEPSISDDGRYIAFESYATNLTSDTDANGVADVFVYDHVTGEVALLSRAAGGGTGNARSGEPAISGDGRFVSFGSAASNLVQGDTNALHDVYLVDRGPVQPMPTGTATATSVATPTDTATATVAASATPLPAFTATATATGGVSLHLSLPLIFKPASPTATPTRTATRVPTVTPTLIPTFTAIPATPTRTSTALPTRTATRVPTRTHTPTANCSSAYPTVCIPDPPPDLDCSDIPHRDFTVLPPDPHRFDSDEDGVGCETP